MAIALNEYATKAYSEHPIALWSLDDDAYFVSLIKNNNNRNFSSWSGQKVLRVNLSPNPSIEINANTWSNSTGAVIPTRTQIDSLFGSASLLMKKNTSAGTVRLNSQITTALRTAPAVSGQTYSFSMYVKPLTNQRFARSRLTFYNSSNVAIGSVIIGESILANTGTWTRIPVIATAPSGSVTVLVQIEVLNAGANEEFLWDGALLEQSLEVLDYFDGSFVFAQWSSQEGLSTSIAYDWFYEDNPDLISIDPSPFSSSTHSMISAINPKQDAVLEAISPEMFTFDQLNSELKSFCMNLWLYQGSVGVKEFQVGYIYQNSNGSDIEKIEYFPGQSVNRNRWLNFYFQDPIPTNILPNSYFKVIIRIVLNEPFSPTQEYDFILNGLSIGQWSERACFKNLGADTTNLEEFSFEGNVVGIIADQYGLLSENGYYLVEDNRMLSDNNGLSLVFGSENSTMIYPSKYNNPSFIFPGKDMLHELGRYKEFTLELWLTIDLSTTKSLKILGPLDSDYGLYVKDGVLSLVVGDEIIFYDIKEWYRPMLLHIVLENESASLFINGEQVGSIPLNRREIDLTNKLNWWGIYSYSDIDSFKVDCISIYPYIFPLQVAKKRFVWGQGVDTLQFIDSEFSGTTAAIDFSFANYDVSQIYPDINRWDAGYFDNLSVSQASLSMPSYSLPDTFLGGGENSSNSRNIKDFYGANKTVNELTTGEIFFTFRPNLQSRFNYMLKPSIETLPWTDFGTSSAFLCDECSFIGDYSLRITLAGEDTKISAPRGFDDFEIPEPGVYWVSAYFWVPAASPLIGETVEFFAEGDWAFEGITLLESNPITLTSLQWMRASAKFEINNSTFLGKFAARISEIIPGAILNTDAWMIEKSDELKEYFDGDSPYAEWLGTPAVSISTRQEWVTEGSDWTENSYLRFDWNRLFLYPVNSVYGIFEVTEMINESRPLLHLINGKRRFEINIINDEVNYSFDNEDPFYTQIITMNEKFVVGFNIEKLSQFFGTNVLSFFTSPGGVKMFAGGNGRSGQNAKTFEGKIYKVSVMNENNYRNLLAGEPEYFLDNEWAYTTFFEKEVDAGEPNTIFFESTVDGGDTDGPPEEYFNSFGITETEYTQYFHDFYTMYSLVPIIAFNRFFFDIEVRSEWEEYYPLSTFATYVKDANLNPYYDLDYFQIDIGHPLKKEYITIANEESFWNYGGFGDPLFNEVVGSGSLFDIYKNPVQKTYSVLDNEIITNYENYNNLQNNLTIEKVFNFDNSDFKAYITFQRLSQNYRPLSSFINTKRLDESRVVVADDINPPADPFLAYNTKFEITDHTVVYPPTTLNFKDVIAVTHFTFRNDGIISNPIQIRDFEISAKTANETIPTEIGTKYGTSMYPYTKDYDAFNYKEKNPILIYKGNTPYMYTTSKSGVKVNNTSIGERQYGIKIPVNDAETSNLQVGGIQFWAKYDYIQFARNGIEIMEIDNLNDNIEIVVIQDYSQDRGIVRARNKRTGGIDPNVVFYQNGVYVTNPIIYKNEWNSIGMEFLEPLSFDQYPGSINLLGGVMFNNIAFFLPKGLGKLSTVLARPWLRILIDNTVSPAQTNIWNDWYYVDPFTNNTWKKVLVESESSTYLITPEDIHRTYIGVNKNIVGDEYTFNFKNKGFSYAKEISWSRYSNKPV
jgi:hypothetical protein